MSKVKTEKYKFNLPAYDEIADINDINENMNLIEEALQKFENGSKEDKKQLQETLKEYVKSDTVTKLSKEAENLKSEQAKIREEMKPLASKSELQGFASKSELQRIKETAGQEEYILQTITTSGNVTLPSDAIRNEIDIICIGGGNGGTGNIAPSRNYSTSGDNYGFRGLSGGVIEYHTTIKAGDIATVTIGAGGKGIITQSGTYDYSNIGGETTFKYPNNCVINIRNRRNYKDDTKEAYIYNIFTNSDVSVNEKMPEKEQSSGYPGYRFSRLLYNKGIYIKQGRSSTDVGIDRDGSVGQGYGGGGDSGGKASQRNTKGGDGMQGCVYIGYWRRKK